MVIFKLAVFYSISKVYLFIGITIDTRYVLVHFSAFPLSFKLNALEMDFPQLLDIKQSMTVMSVNCIAIVQWPS